MSGDDDSEKQHEPSEKRLAEARKRGEIPRSADVNTAAAMAGFLVATLQFGKAMVDGLGASLAHLLGDADQISTAIFAGGIAALAPDGLGIGAAVAPLFLIPAGFVLASLLVQRAIIFAPDKLMPKLSRISPVAAAKQKFGRDGLFEFGKSSVKLGIIAVILWKFLFAHLPTVVGSVSFEPALATAVLADLLIRFLGLVLVLSLIIGALDLLWQWLAHRRRNRMSRQDMIDEHKEAEGDPHVKGQRRQRGYDIAMNRMIADVPKADVIIVNPTHYAVALRWKRSDRSAPVLVAKGTDAIAARIREAAAAAGVPIRSDPPTARAIHATVEIGAPILREQYQAVAAAIRFAETMRARAKRGAK